MDKKQLCIYCQKWESGGIEAFLYNALSHADLSAFDIDLVVEQLGESVFTQPLKDKGIRFITLSGNIHRVKENEQLFREILAKRNYSAVWLNIYQAMSLRYLSIAKSAGVDIRIAHSHNTALRSSATRLVKLWLHRCYSNICAKDATTFWACSEAAAQFMFPHTLLQERGYTFIPNGIETNRFRFDPSVRQTVRQELGLDNRFIIGNIGRLCYQKNQLFLLDILVQARKLHPDSCLLLVGDGEDRQMLEKEARDLGVSDHVIFYGTTKQVEKLFWAMDVFAFPSRFEGLGIVAVEAQAAGLPVVCSEHIPREAFVTNHIQCLPLNCGAQAWADALLRCKSEDREPAHEAVRQAGFDITDIVRNIAF